MLTYANVREKKGPAMPVDLDDVRWDAVCIKNRDLDGEFVFAVKTTGIYCRPSCPAKTAKRQNVEFYETTVLAQQAGYRACKRCHPDGVSQEHSRNSMIETACQLIKNSEAPLKLETLASKMAMSPHHFHRIFKELTGVTPKQYQSALQKEKVRSLLNQSASISGAIYDAGYNSASRFYEMAGAMLGMSPKAYRAGAEDLQMQYMVCESALGLLLIASTEKGICTIEFGDSASVLEQVLQQRFPKASIRAAETHFKEWVTSILAYIQQPRGLLDLPLDVQGTAFQQRVWKALQDIPPGQTASYAEIAKRIGSPSSVRAVANACASNQFAVAIPCHRVIRSDGDVTGYRWGMERKKALLKRESET
ncbi:bifunctional DNA-binding transcriptional regulator/O6-methylguanine-DNA methyltransferase Ada [Undibacterium umbellatum]|nr:bifunctional DNA-binding transcriptional regulator/O6-methylguanine-DNA methyltransferase Ada [Undibacterium umbellatum]